jgi:phosphohistidine swiveling domain-containing protein
VNVLRGQAGTGGRGAAGSETPVVLARAAVLDAENDRPVLSADLLADAARHARRPADGPLEVVLIARRVEEARYVRLPGLAIVGVVSEDAADDGASGPPLDLPFPVVWGVPGALADIPDGELVILDAVRARVVVAPDAIAVARAQAPAERPRLLLGAAHTPAVTRAGRVVPVWAAVTTNAELSAALEAGADGLLLTGDGALLPAMPTSGPTPPPGLLAAAEAVGGGAVACQTVPWDLVDPLALVGLAARCDLRWLVSPADLPLPRPPTCAMNWPRSSPTRKRRGGRPGLPRCARSYPWPKPPPRPSRPRSTCPQPTRSRSPPLTRSWFS